MAKNDHSDSLHSNSQSLPVKYIAKTSTDCRVCMRDKMHVRFERPNKGKESFTQQLECPVCGETYPREVSSDRKTVLADPFSDTKHVR